MGRTKGKRQGGTGRGKVREEGCLMWPSQPDGACRLQCNIMLGYMQPFTGHPFQLISKWHTISRHKKSNDHYYGRCVNYLEA